MAYNIYKSNGTQLVTLDDYIIDNTTLSINLIGKNVSGFGTAQNENFLYMLEHFASEIPPANALAGQIWFDTNTQILRPIVYDGGTWRPLGVTLVATTSSYVDNLGNTISAQSEGDFWYHSGNQQLYINTGTGFSLIGPQAVPGFGVTRMVSVAMNDYQDTPHPVIQTILNDEVIAITSNKEFIPNGPGLAMGFNKVYRGITFKNYSSSNRYSNTSTDVILHGLHEQLDETYPRRDQDEHITGNWVIDTFKMLQFGTGGQSKIQYQTFGGGFPPSLTLDNPTGILTLSANGSTLTFDGDALTPNATNLKDLGTAGSRFKTLYAQGISAGILSSAESTIHGTWKLTAGSQIDPGVDSGNNLGTATLRYGNVYTFALNAGADLGTIRGDWQLAQTIKLKPQNDLSNDLGESGKRFNTVYATGLSAGNSFERLAVQGELALDGSLIPEADQTYNIGSPTKKFNTVYTNDLLTDTANIGALTAAISQISDSFQNTITRFDRDAQLTSNSDTRLPTQRSVKSYVDATKDSLIQTLNDIATQLTAQINGLEFLPASSVLYVARSTAPSGFLVCDGTAYQTSSYPRLFQAIGYTYGGSGVTFRVPDLRGEFVRGWDGGRNVDTGRTFGSAQADSLGTHAHNMDDLYGLNDDQGPALIDRNGNRIERFSSWGSDGDNDSGNPVFYETKTANAGSAETRPRNVALLPIIKT